MKRHTRLVAPKVIKPAQGWNEIIQELGAVLPVIQPVPAKLWDIERDGITQGFLETLGTCPEKARLSYEEGWSSVKFRGAMKFGDVFHFCLDHVYTTFRDTGNATLAIVSREGALSADEFLTRESLKQAGMLTSETEQELEELYGLADLLLSHYFRHYQRDFNGGMKWETLEQVFDVPYYGLPVPVRRRGKIDGTFRAPNKRLWMLETKTKGQIAESALMDRLNYDLQCFFYLDALRELTGEIPAGVLYNVVRRPMLRRKKGETLREYLDRVDEDIKGRRTHYFMRWEVAVTTQDMDRWRAEFNAMMLDAWDFARNGRRYRRSGSCETKYGTCEFTPVCANGFFGTLERKQTPFPELAGNEEE